MSAFDKIAYKKVMIDFIIKNSIYNESHREHLQRQSYEYIERNYKLLKEKTE